MLRKRKETEARRILLRGLDTFIHNSCIPKSVFSRLEAVACMSSFCCNWHASVGRSSLHALKEQQKFIFNTTSQYIFEKSNSWQNGSIINFNNDAHHIATCTYGSNREEVISINFAHLCAFRVLLCNENALRWKKNTVTNYHHGREKADTF